MGSSCQPHEPTSVWLPASYPCGMPSLGHLQFRMVRDVKGLSVLSLPDIQIGSFLPTWKNISPCGNLSPSLYITSWSVQLASLTCIPMSVQKPSVLGLLFQALSLFHYIFHMQSHPQARLCCILYSFNPKLSCEFQANITNNPEAASS